MENVVALSLQAPNVAVDMFGNTGTWTLIYNQGFEVTVSGRTYTAFSYYTQVGNRVPTTDLPGIVDDVAADVRNEGNLET